MEEVVGLLTSESGSLAYHLLLLFALLMALTGSLKVWRVSNESMHRRALFALILLLLIRLVGFTISAILVAANAPAASASIVRTIAAFEAILFVWIWLFAHRTRSGDFATALLIFLTAFGSVLAAFIFASSTAAYNSSWAAIAWGVYTLLILGLGIIGLLIRRPVDWGTGGAMLALLAIGHILQMVFGTAGQLPGWLRVLEVAAFPLLLLLPHRRSVTTGTPRTMAAETVPHMAPTRERYRIDPKTLENILKLSTESDISELCVTIARAISHAMLADVCFLLSAPSREGDISLQCGYDLILEAQLSGGILSSTQPPMVAAAIEQRKALRLPVSSNSDDLDALRRALGLQNSGHLLVVPISFPDQEPIGAIGLFSPYSDRDWGADEENFLVRISAVLAEIIERTHKNQGHAENLQEVQSAMEQFREQAALATAEKVELENQILELQNQYSGDEVQPSIQPEPVDPAESLELLREQVSSAKQKLNEADQSNTELLDRQKEAARVIRQLQGENDKLKRASAAAATLAAVAQNGEKKEAPNDLNKSLKITTNRVAELERIASIHEQDAEHWQLLVALSDELQFPIDEIKSYADFLLDESTGDLGPLQRKYLDQINDSLTQIRAHTRDLSQLALPQAGQSVSEGPLIDMSDVIDTVMGQVQSQFGASEHVLRLDLPEDLPQIRGDRAALERMLLNLLQNAGNASPEGSAVALWAAYRSFDEGVDFIELGIEDSGDGVPKELLGQLFLRPEADSAPIPGIGSSHSTLVVARTLVEAHNGRIWAESSPGKGTAIHVLLPLTQSAIATAEETWDGR